MSTGTTLEEGVAPRTAVPPDAPGAHDGSEIVTFPDLVRAHQAWERELYGADRDGQKPDRALEWEFHRRWRQFERKYGRIETAYWSVRQASAVALTIKDVNKRRRRDERIPRFHRATDWATRDEPEVARALDECEILAARTEEILRGPSELIALRRITAVASHLLGYVDRSWGRESPPPTGQPTPDWSHQAECKAFVERQRHELKDVERFYRRTGNGQAKILFFWGMVQGLVFLALVTALASVLIWGADNIDDGQGHWGQLQLLAICVMAGALGAFLSVLTRMAALTGKFHLDFEVGRMNVRWLGLYRPLVGGIFGVATFLLLASEIMQTNTPGPERDYAYYGILAFFSGFFERFTKLPTGDMPSVGETGAAAKADKAENAADAGKAQSGA
jgi:hypothetical protein